MFLFSRRKCVSLSNRVVVCFQHTGGQLILMFMAIQRYVDHDGRQLWYLGYYTDVLFPDIYAGASHGRI